MKIIRIIKKIVIYTSVIMLLCFVTAFGGVFWMIKNTQNKTDEIYNTIKSAKSVTTLFEKEKIPGIICSGQSHISFFQDKKLVASSFCKNEMKKNNLEEIETLKEVHPNYNQLLERADRLNITVMPGFPYRGTVEVSYDKSLNITKIKEPYFWD